MNTWLMWECNLNDYINKRCEIWAMEMMVKLPLRASHHKSCIMFASKKGGDIDIDGLKKETLNTVIKFANI